MKSVYYLLSDSLAQQAEDARGITKQWLRASQRRHTIPCIWEPLFAHLVRSYRNQDEVEGGNAYYHEGKIMPMVLPS